MTREEARKTIRKMLAVTDLSVRGNLKEDMVKACNIAIEALEQEPAVAEIKLQKIRFIIEDKTTASNYKVEQIKGVLDEER